MIEIAKKHILDEDCSVCAVTSDGQVFMKSGSSVRPLLKLYDENKDELQSSYLADRVIGKAAAMIICDMHCTEVYAHLMSESGYSMLKKHGIQVSYSILCEIIQNMSGTDMCPMEKAVINTDDLKEGIANIRKFISTINEWKL